MVRVKPAKQNNKDDDSLLPDYNVNQDIKADKVRLLDEDEEHIGVVPTNKALKKAEQEDLDLVEINPKANPPVARMVNYSSFKYEKEKEIKKQQAKSRDSKVKGVRLSLNIGDHDKNTRRKQAEKFLERGDKVKIELYLKGRQHEHRDRAKEVIEDFIDEIEETIPVKFEKEIESKKHKLTTTIVKDN
ncbi:MAG: translation initiation factor IF-3 [Candidatus Magasanikbacteria bacterium]